MYNKIEDTDGYYVITTMQSFSGMSANTWLLQKHFPHSHDYVNFLGFFFRMIIASLILFHV